MICNVMTPRFPDMKAKFIEKNYIEENLNT